MAESGVGGSASQTTPSTINSAEIVPRLGRASQNEADPSQPAVSSPGSHAMRPISPPSNSLESTRRSGSPQNPSRTTSPRLPLHPSPRVNSPASSQIFERSVQEDIAPSQASPSIPSHVLVENHIPPILDASSEALTDDRLDPDSVEIVTHNFHQPAVLPVANAPADHPAASTSWPVDPHPGVPAEAGDFGSNYGPTDSTDIKRLSFVSFADLVAGEHAENADLRSNRNSIHLPSHDHPGLRNRSPSPVLSPAPSHGPGTSPPTTISSPSRAIETSPHRGIRVPSSPGHGSGTPPVGTLSGELSVETMTQALRRTGSGDLSLTGTRPLGHIVPSETDLDGDRAAK